MVCRDDVLNAMKIWNFVSGKFTSSNLYSDVSVFIWVFLSHKFAWRSLLSFFFCSFILFYLYFLLNYWRNLVRFHYNFLCYAENKVERFVLLLLFPFKSFETLWSLSSLSLSSASWLASAAAVVAVELPSSSLMSSPLLSIAMQVNNV